ncbi:MAG: hypothetical protein ACP8RL_05060, partial [cyanobacterium endosymbiont of Rhopalodia inflata]
MGINFSYDITAFVIRICSPAKINTLPRTKAYLLKLNIVSSLGANDRIFVNVFSVKEFTEKYQTLVDGTLLIST